MQAMEPYLQLYRLLRLTEESEAGPRRVPRTPSLSHQRIGCDCGITNSLLLTLAADKEKYEADLEEREEEDADLVDLDDDAGGGEL